MARRKRGDGNRFNMSFLDIMSCGFGAVVLIFLIIRHSVSEHADEVNAQILDEVQRLEADVGGESASIASLRAELESIERELAEARERETQNRETAASAREQLEALRALRAQRENSIASLESEIDALETRSEESSFGEDDEGDALVTIEGDGRRQYLTGLQVGGERILVLLDRSASMLDETVVNIIRRRNMATSRQLEAPKWQRAVRTVDWLAAQFPITSRFQIYTFSETVEATTDGSLGRWLDVNGPSLAQALDAIGTTVPGGGTDLARAFAAIEALSPAPDSVYLITDGLPTRADGAPDSGLVSSARRLELFQRAQRALPPGVPMNVLLFPLEGDPLAAAAYWKLAINTRGSFMSPSRNWP